jgi:septum formation protein
LNKIILASGSPRRKKLLQQINFSFKVHPSKVDESYDPSLSPDEIVQELASRKAKDIAQHYDHALVVGADTIVVFENQILEKPANQQEARKMLRKLSGQTHQVLTGVALYKIDAEQNIMESYTFVETTDVIFGELKSHNIDAYVETGSPMDKAGSYGIQDDYGAIFVRRIEGDYYNVVGFPLHRFYNVMETFAPEFLPRTQIDEQADE